MYYLGSNDRIETQPHVRSASIHPQVPDPHVPKRRITVARVESFYQGTVLCCYLEHTSEVSQRQRERPQPDPSCARYMSWSTSAKQLGRIQK